jgi:pimeloyl-ACP methyl ester carboxylesterase
MATQPNTHVLTIDYRGFGYSSGSPPEAGLIIDGTTLVNWVLRVANIPPERIVIVGQSLGTGVSSAIALHYADPSNPLIPSEARDLQPLFNDPSIAVFEPTTFAGVVLAAPFSSIPALLLTYRLGGLLPLLLPLRPVPDLAARLTSQMVDKWLSAERLTAYYAALKDHPTLLHTGERSLGSVQLVHALNDRDIPFHQTEMICRRMFGKRDASSEIKKEEIEAEECINGSKGAGVLDVKRAGRPRVRFEIVRFGGKSNILFFPKALIFAGTDSLSQVITGSLRTAPFTSLCRARLEIISNDEPMTIDASRAQTCVQAQLG